MDLTERPAPNLLTLFKPFFIFLYFSLSLRKSSLIHLKYDFTLALHVYITTNDMEHQRVS